MIYLDYTFDGSDYLTFIRVCMFICLWMFVPVPPTFET